MKKNKFILVLIILVVIAVLVCLFKCGKANDNGKFAVTGNDIDTVKIVSDYNANEKLDTMDTIVFGKYPQNDTNEKNKQQIEWLILEKDDNNQKALLMSKYILDFRPYSNVEDFYSIGWGNSDLRSWANSTFYDLAFSAAEKKYITSYNNYIDNVFALTEDDMDRLFGAQIKDGNHWYNYKRATKGTNYALGQEVNGNKLYVVNSDDLAINGNSGYIINGNKYVSIDYEGAIPIFSGLSGFRPVICVSYDGIKGKTNVKAINSNKTISEENIENRTAAETKSQNPLVQRYEAIRDGVKYEMDGYMPGTKMQVDPKSNNQEAKIDSEGNLWVLHSNSSFTEKDLTIYYADGTEDNYGSMTFEGEGYTEYYVDKKGVSSLEKSDVLKREHDDMVQKFYSMTDCYNNFK